MKKEIWKSVPQFEDYKVSNIGNVISTKFGKNKYLKFKPNNSGYYFVGLNGKTKKMFSVHQLVAITFLNHKPNGYKLVVNHKNFIKTDNRVENLEIITNRENLNKKHIKTKSNYIGVSKHSKDKWRSSIYVDGKSLFLGVFDSEKEASSYYNNACVSINNGTEIKIKKSVCASKYKGVSWNNLHKKWISRRTINGKRLFFGYFENEYDAHLEYENSIKL